MGTHLVVQENCLTVPAGLCTILGMRQRRLRSFAFTTMAFATPFSIRKPQFCLGEESGLDRAREAIREAVRAGRIICRMAPREFWVDICERKSDEWADYAKARGTIVWSLARINDILARADVKDSFGRTWENGIRSRESIAWLIGAELGEEIIRQAAAREEIDINGSWQHFADSSSETSVTITWHHITTESRFGIGN